MKTIISALAKLVVYSRERTKAHEERAGRDKMCIEKNATVQKREKFLRAGPATKMPLQGLDVNWASVAG